MLHLRLFGGLTLDNGGGPIVGAAGQRGRLALLAVLASAGTRSVSRDLLLAMFWPEKDGESARGALRHGLYKLRQDIGEPELTLGTTELKLNPAIVSSDVQDFDAAIKSGDSARAVELYAGSFLEGIHLSDAPEFERWAERERGRRAIQFRDAVETLAKSATARGDFRAAAEFWKRLTTADPTSGTAAVALANSLIKAGDRTAALKGVLTHVRVVRAELDLDPDPAVVALIQELRGAGVEESVRLAPRAHGMTLTVEAARGTSVSTDETPVYRQADREVALTRAGGRLRAIRILGVSLVALVTLAVIATISNERSSLFAGSRGAAALRRTAIAVLPFDNVSSGTSHDYFAGGLHGELLNQLSKVRGLTVTSRSTVLTYGNAGTRTTRQIAAELGVGTVVEGSTQVVGNRLRVHVQLIDAASDSPIWSERFDRTIDDAFVIQSEIARRIVSAVGAALTGAETRGLTTAPTSSAEAYRLYLQGRDSWFNQPRNSATIAVAAESFERALALDPEFALAHAALADVHGYHVVTRIDRSPSRMERQHEHAQAALRLAPELPEAHLAMGGWYYHSQGDYASALDELRIAVAGLPNDDEAWARLGQVHRRFGNYDDALAAHLKTTALAPSSADRFKELGVTYRWLHRYEEAVTALDRAIELMPQHQFYPLFRARFHFSWTGDADQRRQAFSRVNFWSLGDMRQVPLWLLFADQRVDSMMLLAAEVPGGVFESQTFFIPAALYRAWAHQLNGDSAAARRGFQEARLFADSALRLLPDDERIHAARGFALAGLGLRDQARDEARWLRRSVPYREDKFQGSLVAINRARILALVGDVADAVNELRPLLDKPSLLSLHELRVDPLFAPIRDEPLFQALIAR